MQQVYQQQLLQQQQQQNSSTPNGDSSNSNSTSEHTKTAASPIPDGVTPISPCGDDEEGEIVAYVKFVVFCRTLEQTWPLIYDLSF